MNCSIVVNNLLKFLRKILYNFHPKLFFLSVGIGCKSHVRLKMIFLLSSNSALPMLDISGLIVKTCKVLEAFNLFHVIVFVSRS